MNLSIGTLVTIIGPFAVDCSCLRVEIGKGQTIRGRVAAAPRPPLSVGEPAMVMVEFDGHGVGDVEVARVIPDVAVDVVDVGVGGVASFTFDGMTAEELRDLVDGLRAEAAAARETAARVHDVEAENAAMVKERGELCDRLGLTGARADIANIPDLVDGLRAEVAALRAEVADLRARLPA